MRKGRREGWQEGRWEVRMKGGGGIKGGVKGGGRERKEIRLAKKKPLIFPMWFSSSHLMSHFCIVVEAKITGENQQK